MPFKPGRSGNPEGRPKGTGNKVTHQVKNLIEQLIADNAPSLKAEFKVLKGKDKMKAFVDLLPYVVPRLQSTSLDVEIERLSDEQLDELYTRIINGSKRI